MSDIRKAVDWSPELVISTLEEVVAGHEDFVYQMPDGAQECLYSTKDGAPSCIVGHVVKRLDPELFERIHNEEWEGVVEGDGDQPFAFGWTTFVDVNNLGGDVAQQALVEAQESQDTRHPWAEALEAAKRYVIGYEEEGGF